MALFSFSGIFCRLAHLSLEGNAPVGLFLGYPCYSLVRVVGFWASGWVFELDSFYEFGNYEIN